MSKLLRQAGTEAREGNSNIKQQVRDIGSKFVNNVEISAQEAVYIVLQLPMRKASREVIFINTSPPEDRVELLKPLNDIKDMEDDCEEIYSGGLLKRYSKHPIKFEHVMLADWAAWYDSNLLPRAFSSTIFKMADRPEKTLAKARSRGTKISKNLGDFYHVTFWEKVKTKWR